MQAIAHSTRILSYQPLHLPIDDEGVVVSRGRTVQQCLAGLVETVGISDVDSLTIPCPRNLGGHGAMGVAGEGVTVVGQGVVVDVGHPEGTWTNAEV